MRRQRVEVINNGENKQKERRKERETGYRQREGWRNEDNNETKKERKVRKKREKTEKEREIN